MKADLRMESIQVLRSVSALREFVALQRGKGLRVGLVPTMGALHEGHLTLVREGFGHADVMIATIFVNPTQFAPTEDFAAYPRTQEDDIRKLSQTGAQAVFCPDASEMYPQGFSTSVSVKGVSEPLEGESRPHFFGGVATVVTKLLLQALPDVALFGEKDYQQLQVIKRLVIDLDIPVKIIGVATVRDRDGLALSSRNAYLTQEQMKSAAVLNRVLFDMADQIRDGGDLGAIRQAGMERIMAAGFDSIDYLEIRDASTLMPVDGRNNALRILVAAKIGKTRLIDNVAA
ncbi:MAG: pantoate--beta-alanine ligase [Micavibrio sp.]|nr:pantoate--beta-alanine ligase [Micavibrio sp.]